MAFYIIVGKPGAGKTLMLSYFQYLAMLDGVGAYKRACREINNLNMLGFNDVQQPPLRHLCYSDYDFKINRKYKSYYIDGYQLALPNPYFETKYLPVGSYIFLDEAQRYYDSRYSMSLRPEVYRWFQLHRHNDYTIYMTAQRLANIDINIRSIAEKIIVIDELKLKQNEYGLVKKISWKYHEFESCDTAESYCLNIDIGKKSNLGVQKKLSTNINVCQFYDTKSNKPVFYDVSYSKNNKLDYNYEVNEGYDFSLDGVIDFNSKRKFSAPKGYYKR